MLSRNAPKSSKVVARKSRVSVIFRHDVRLPARALSRSVLSFMSTLLPQDKAGSNLFIQQDLINKLSPVDCPVVTLSPHKNFERD